MYKRYNKGISHLVKRKIQYYQDVSSLQIGSILNANPNKIPAGLFFFPVDIDKEVGNILEIRRFEKEQQLEDPQHLISKFYYEDTVIKRMEFGHIKNRHIETECLEIDPHICGPLVF